MIHSRVLWMLRPVERSITVSAPQRIDQTSLSTSSSMEEETAELPILALIFTRKLRPMIIGSSSGWLMLAGMMARPRAISERTNSGVMKAGISAPKLSPSAIVASAPSSMRLAAEVLALGDVDHLLGDDAGARELVLGDRRVADTAQRLVGDRKGAGEVLAGVAVVLGANLAALIGLDAAALENPGGAGAGEAFLARR